MKKLLASILLGTTLLTGICTQASVVNKFDYFRDDTVSELSKQNIKVDTDLYGVLKIVYEETNNSNKPQRMGNRIVVFQDGVELNCFRIGIDENDMVTKTVSNIKPLYLQNKTQSFIEYYKYSIKGGDLTAYDLDENKVIKEIKTK